MFSRLEVAEFCGSGSVAALLRGGMDPRVAELSVDPLITASREPADWGFGSDVDDAAEVGVRPLDSIALESRPPSSDMVGSVDPSTDSVAGATSVLTLRMGVRAAVVRMGTWGRGAMARGCAAYSSAVPTESSDLQPVDARHAARRSTAETRARSVRSSRSHDRFMIRSRIGSASPVGPSQRVAVGSSVSGHRKRSPGIPRGLPDAATGLVWRPRRSGLDTWARPRPPPRRRRSLAGRSRRGPVRMPRTSRAQP